MMINLWELCEQFYLNSSNVHQTKVGLYLDIVTSKTVTDDFKTGIKLQLHSTGILGTVAQIQSGWTLPLAMKLLYGYFNDMLQMNEQFGQHYCDGHPGNILVNIVNKSNIHFFWSDPGKTSSSRYMHRSDSKMNPQFLSSVDLMFDLMLNSWKAMNDAIRVVQIVQSYHASLLEKGEMSSWSYFPRMVTKIRSEIEKEMSRKDWDAFMSLLHPSSQFSESVSSRRLRVIEDQLQELNDQFQAQKDQFQELNDQFQVRKDQFQELNDQFQVQKDQFQELNDQFQELEVLLSYVQNMTNRVIVFE
jgi:hypothetical protein